jgi:membrane protein required for colicin V production
MMSIYDIIMLIIFGGAICFGYWKGLAWQIASVAAIVVSYIVAVNFREPVAQLIQVEEPWNRIGAMLILFIGTSLVIWTVYAQVSKSLKKMELKGFDRQAGALLGAVKGALLCMVITMFSVTLLGEQAHNAIHNSRIGPYVVTGITKVSAIVPEEVSQITQKYVDEFHQKIGHDGNLPTGQYPNPIFGANQYPAEGPSPQDPSQLPPSTPAYKGQWQTPTLPWGKSGQSAVWNQPTGTSANQPGDVQYGTTIGGGFPAQSAPGQTSNGTVFNGSNGWPEFNFNVNTKDLLDAAAEAAAEAAKRAFENNQPR